ncbi:MAG TPA: hypothetical protein VGC41_17210 [Kofleriaceae bacterium]
MIRTRCMGDGWSDELRACVYDGDDPNGCLTTQAPDVEKAIVDLSATAKKLAAAKQKPASITCAAVASAHYSDAQAKAHKLGAKDLKASRTEMQRVCTADKWPDATRACAVVADGDNCYTQAIRWSYPAIVVTRKNVPANCALYRAVVDRVTTCNTKLPKETITALRDAFDQTEKSWTAITNPDDQKIWNDACAAGVEAMATTMTLCAP